MPAPQDAVLWLEPTQAAFAERMAAAGGWRVAAAGLPRSALGSEAAREAASRFNLAAPIPDLRHELATTEAKLFVVLTPLPEEGDRAGAVSPLDDPQILSACAARGIDLITLEPWPASLLDRAASAPVIPSAPIIRQTPLWCRSAAFTQVADAMPLIGTPRCVSISFRSGPGEGSLAARLVDACAALIALPVGAGGVPESIDAAAVTPRGNTAAAVHLALPDRLRQLRGDLTANLRIPARAGSVCASITLSDGAGPWQRRLRIVGELGSIEASDHSVQLFDTAGTPLDDHATPRHAPEPDRKTGTLWDPASTTPRANPAKQDASDAAAIAGLQARLELDRRAPADPIDWASVLAVAEAALLSARTGQNESPATLLRMAGVPG